MLRGAARVDAGFDLGRFLRTRFRVGTDGLLSTVARSVGLGAVFIRDAPIFNGLATSLLFGIFVSTLPRLVVIPVLYYLARCRSALSVQR